jgi:hypothetical protein
MPSDLYSAQEVSRPPPLHQRHNSIVEITNMNHFVHGSNGTILRRETTHVHHEHDYAHAYLLLYHDPP